MCHCVLGFSEAIEFSHNVMQPSQRGEVGWGQRINGEHSCPLYNLWIWKRPVFVLLASAGVSGRLCNCTIGSCRMMISDLNSFLVQTNKSV